VGPGREGDGQGPEAGGRAPRRRGEDRLGPPGVARQRPPLRRLRAQAGAGLLLLPAGGRDAGRPRRERPALPRRRLLPRRGRLAGPAPGREDRLEGGGEGPPPAVVRAGHRDEEEALISADMTVSGGGPYSLPPHSLQGDTFHAYPRRLLRIP